MAGSAGLQASVGKSGGQRTKVSAHAHRDDGRHFIVRADEKPTAFLELESTILCLQMAQKWITAA
jgi:hypothetical protein